MAIARPITKTIISTTAWGIPITDAVNANTTDIAALKPTAWTNATLQNGWTHESGSPVQYRKVGDDVQIRGRCNGTSVAWQVIFALPVGFRTPGTFMGLGACVSAGAWGLTTLNISYDGTISSSDSRTLTAISFNLLYSSIA